MKNTGLIIALGVVSGLAIAATVALSTEKGRNAAEKASGKVKEVSGKAVAKTKEVSGKAVAKTKEVNCEVISVKAFDCVGGLWGVVLKIKVGHKDIVFWGVALNCIIESRFVFDNKWRIFVAVFHYGYCEVKVDFGCVVS